MTEGGDVTYQSVDENAQTAREGGKITFSSSNKDGVIGNFDFELVNEEDNNKVAKIKGNFKAAPKTF